MQVTLIALSTAFLLAGPQAPLVQRPSLGTFTVADCQITLIEDRDVPAQQAGVLKQLRTPKRNLDGSYVLDAQGEPEYEEVREGLEVVEGQLLGRIDDEMERKLKEVADYKLEVARMEAANYISVQYAKAAHQVATAEVDMSKEANRLHPGTVPAAELRRQLLAQKQAELQIEQSEYDLKINKVSVSVREAEAQVADLQIGQREIVAPTDGIVVERNFDEGEWVKPGDIVLRIVGMKQLRIEGTVERSRLAPDQVRKGQRVTVRLGPDQRQTVPGRIVFVNPQVFTGSRYEVWAVVDNVRIGAGTSQSGGGAWLLNPGLKAEMTIHLD